MFKNMAQCLAHKLLSDWKVNKIEADWLTEEIGFSWLNTTALVTAELVYHTLTLTETRDDLGMISINSIFL